RLARAAAAHARTRAPGGAPARGQALALRAGRPGDGRGADDGRSRRQGDRQDRGPGGPQAVSATAEVPTGNTYDKYGSTNPVVRRLMRGFHAALDELWADAAPTSLLDVGCGEG